VQVLKYINTVADIHGGQESGAGAPLFKIWPPPH